MVSEYDAHPGPWPPKLSTHCRRWPLFTVLVLNVLSFLANGNGRVFPQFRHQKIYIFASFSWCIHLHFKRKISHEGCFMSALSKTRLFTQSKILLLLVSRNLTSSWVVPYNDAKSLWQDVLAHAVHLNSMRGCLNVGKRTKQQFFPRTPLQFSTYRNWTYSNTFLTQQHLWLRRRCYHLSRVPSS